MPEQESDQDRVDRIGAAILDCESGHYQAAVKRDAKVSDEDWCDAVVAAAIAINSQAYHDDLQKRESELDATLSWMNLAPGRVVALCRYFWIRGYAKGLTDAARGKG